MKKAHGPKAFLDTLSTLVRNVSSLGAEMYGEVGMGRTQAKVLRQVARREGISQAELARATDTDPALTGRTLQGLLERGMLRRERSESDRREHLLYLGPQGREALERVERVRTRFAERLVRPLDEHDLEDFDRIATKLLAALTAENEAGQSTATAATPRPRSRGK